MFVGKDHVDVEVQDSIVLAPNCRCDIERRYRFTNANPTEATISWDGLDLLPDPGCDVAFVAGPANYLGDASEGRKAISWSISDCVLGQDNTLEVVLKFQNCGHVLTDPLRIPLEYAPTWTCRYGFSIAPPHHHLFDNCSYLIAPKEVAERISLHRTDQGLVGPAELCWLSPNRDRPFSAIVECTITPPPVTRLMRSYIQEAESAPDRPFCDCVLLLIPHLLTDSLAYVRAFRAAGASPDRIFIVGIPYSTKDHVVSSLWLEGFHNLWAPHDYPFLTNVREALAAALACAKRNELKLLIVEDGGYAGPLLHQEFGTDISHCVGIVEQTRNGIWAYKQNRVEPNLPVMNVAECALKLEKESPLIGEAVVNNTARLLGGLGFGLQNYSPLVVGFGSTGRRVAECLKLRGLAPAVFDEDEDRNQAAREANYVVAGSLRAPLQGRNLIIGCTGSEPFRIKELTAVQHDTVFVNASSKRREINYGDLKLVQDASIEQEIIPNIGRRIRLLSGQSFLLLANGYPVNFVGESVPDEDISFIPALLFRTARHLRETATDIPCGFCEIPEALQAEVDDRHDALMPRVRT